MSFAPEGYPYMAFFAVLSALLFVLWEPWAAAPAAALTVFMFFFFRDPERETPQGEGLYIAPADGKVIVVRDTQEKEHLNAPALMISIFMSPLDVHVNRAPCDGTVRSVKYSRGKKKAAYTEEAHLRNENAAMVMSCGGPGDARPPLLLRQVAGSVAQKPVCRVRPGDKLIRGERFGIIKFSSRVDVYLPKGTLPAVKPGDRTRAGETVIAREA